MIQSITLFLPDGTVQVLPNPQDWQLNNGAISVDYVPVAGQPSTKVTTNVPFVVMEQNNQ